MSVRDNIHYRGRKELASQITPKVGVQDDIVAPSGEFYPAPWLPIAFVKADHQRGDAAMVISSGKIVALQRSPYGTSGRAGLLVPAGFLISLKPTSAISNVVLSYTTTDRDWKVTDLVTGEPVAGAVSYTAEQVCDALLRQGLVKPKEVVAAGGAVPVTTVNHCAKVIDAFISKPIGFVPYDIHSYAGFAEKGDQKFTNDREQAAVHFWTEGQLRLPQLCAEVIEEGFDLDAAKVTSAAAGDAPLGGEIWTAAALAGLERYADILSGTELIYGLVLSSVDVAKVTDRTPISGSDATVFGTQVDDVTKVLAAGDFALDVDLGIVFVNKTALDAVTTDSGAGDDITVTYWTNDASTAAAHRYALFAGDARPGDYLTFDKDSNLTTLGSLPLVESTGTISLGRIDDFEVWPKHLQETRKSPWAISASGFDATTRITGSATKGYPDAFTLPELDDNIVADRFVIVHLRIL